MSKDYERKVQTSETRIKLAMIRFWLSACEGEPHDALNSLVLWVTSRHWVCMSIGTTRSLIRPHCSSGPMYT